MRKIIVIAGPTAVGKTEYAIRIAEKFNGEIVSCDSMQLYKYMDIGSAKPTPEEQARAKHYLIDEIDPRDEFSVAIYQKMAKKYIEEIFAKGKTPIIAGGTGLYLNSLIYDMDFASPVHDNELRDKYYKMADEEGKEAVYDILKEKAPDVAARIHPNNLKKVIRALETVESDGDTIKEFAGLEKKCSDYDCLLICLNRDRQQLYDRINMRVDMLVDMGLLDEVKGLMDMGFTTDNIAMKGIGYKEIIDYFNGEYDLDRALELVKRNTRRYAKRQITWFKRYKDMKWFNLSNDSLEDILGWIEENL